MDEPIKETKPVIFICNSETDGFKEGDGDLMDKLTIHINKTQSMEAVRIVMYKQDIPSEIIKKGSLRWLEEKRVKLNERMNYNVKNYQKYFMDILFSPEYENRQKILYIGSRLDWGTKELSFTNDNWGSFKNKETCNNIFSFFDDIKALRKASLVSKDWNFLGKLHLGKTIISNDGVPKELVLKQSGALFDGNFIGYLKDKGVKIVICCLEYQFFFRSKSSLRSAFEMLRQQLFLADSIHFLTKKDKEYFELTMDNLRNNSVLMPFNCENINFESRKDKEKAIKELCLNEDERKQFDFKSTIFFNNLNKESWIEERINSSFYSSGIYTVDPFSISEEELPNLAKREKNIIQFGMIRAEKGIDEALLLADNFKKIGFGKLYIVGKVREFPILRHLILSCFKCESQNQSSVRKKIKTEAVIIDVLKDSEDINNFQVTPDTEKNKYLTFIKSKSNWFFIFYEENKKNIINLCVEKTHACYNKLQGVLSSLNEEEINKSRLIGSVVKIFNIKVGFYNENAIPKNDIFLDAVILACKKIMNLDITRNEAKALSNTAWNILEIGGMDKFNEFADALLKHCFENLEKKIENVEIHFNLPEDDLKKIALKCRYAIKLDHKGMAENASSIVSCLGLYLPTFTTHGYLTNEDFLFKGKYEKVIICPEGSYVLYDENGIFEIRPKLPELEWIFDILRNETDENYQERLQVLFQLFNEGLFKCETLTENIIDHLLGESLNYEKHEDYSVPQNI